MRIVIAGYCGWRPYYGKGNTPWLENPEFYSPNGKFSLLVDLPDYLNDLNAMYSAVMSCPEDEQKAMRAILWEICGQMKAHNATAHQRATAFLKALGLWK